MTYPNVFRLMALFHTTSLLLSFTPVMAGRSSALPFTRSPVSTCPRPELLQADLVTDSTARLTWSDVGDKYEIELVAGTDPFTGVPTYVVNTDPPFDVSGLTPGRNYRFQVRTVCGDTAMSVWSNPRSFTTDLNNARPCPLNFDLRDSSCASVQVFRLHVDNAPGSTLGSDVLLRGVRLMIEHAWRSDLSIWLVSPDSTRIQLIGGLNAGDQNIGDPAGTPCAQYVELSDNAGVAQPLSAAAEQDNFTGYYLPVEALATLHTGVNPVGVWRVEICDNKAVHKGKLRYFELVFAGTGCAPVENVAVNTASANSASISWQTDMAGDSLLIEYGPVGFVPGTGSVPGSGATAIRLKQPASAPVTLSGLQTLKWYAVYIRRKCAPGVWGPNSYAVHFFTNCPPSLQETFNALPLCATGCPDPCPLPGLWQNAPGDDYEWKVYSGPGLTYPVAGPPAAPEGTGNYLYFRNSCSPTGTFGKTAVLRSLCIDVSAPAGQACHFSFDLYMNTKIGQMSSLAFQVSTNGGQSWTTLQSWTGNRGKLWRREYVDLSAYNGQVAIFQFVATGTFGAYGDIALDNLAFYGSQESAALDYTFYRDADGDTYGDPDVRVISCFAQAPAGYVSTDSDCDDTNPAIHPGAVELLCNQTDENCNGMADDAMIPAPPPPPVVDLCYGQSTVLTAPGTPLGQYFWHATAQGGAPVGTGKTLTLNNLTASKTYYLVDSLTGPGGGCSSTRVAVVVNVHPKPALTLALAPSICDGAALDLATLPVVDTANAGGVLTYHSATPTMPANQLPSSVVQPGFTRSYYLLSTSPFGCTGTRSVTVTVYPSPEVQITQGDSINVCRGRSLSLQAQQSGFGLPPITFAWSSGLNFPSIPVQAGNIPGVTKIYTVTVTDSRGCTGTDQIKVHTLNNVTQTAIEAVQDVSTCGGHDGSIALRPLNGTPPYTLAWSGGTLSGVTSVGTITGLSQGSYRVTVTDATNAGCAMVMPQIVLDAPGLDVVLDTILHPACPGAQTGAIALQVSGQAPVVSWSNQQSGATATGLGAGLYSVTITDGNCSQVLSNLEVVAPPPIEISLNALEHVRCFGQTTGRIDLAVFGATPPYTFNWSDAAATEDRTGLAAGSYQCTISDANNCAFTSAAYIITEPPLLALTADSILNVRCFNEKNGYIHLKASGGAGTYKYLWNTGATTASLNGVPAGIYSATVTDANGCTAEWLGVVTQASSLQIEYTYKQSPTCIGAKDGNIQLVISGGQMPFQFSWNNGGNTALLNNLGVGVYRTTVTDAKGCTLVSPPIVLTAPQLLSVALDSLVPVGCRGDHTGLIAVSVSGGVGNLNVSWNTQPGGLVLSDVAAGAYVFQVNDARLCTLKDTFVVMQPDVSLTTAVLSVKNALCAGEPTGSIAVRVIGGTLPYQYLWNHGATIQNLPAVPAGHYSLTVTDANGCTTVLPAVTVGEPPALQVQSTVQDIPCFGATTGDIQLNVSGGIAPYQFFWSNNKATQSVFNLMPGSYSVTVLDATGCAQVLTDLTVVDRKVNFILEPVLVEPVSCGGAADGKIAVRVLNGMPPYQFAWSAPTGAHANVQAPVDTAVALSGGDFKVTVTDAAGCSVVSPAFNIEEAPPLLLNIGPITHIVCKGDTTGRILANVSGGVPSYQLHWSNGASNDTLSEVPAGAYRLTVTDSRGCSVVSPQAFVTEPAVGLEINLLSIKPDKCGKKGGAIQVQVSGGLTPYQYLWSNMATSAGLANVGAGVYQMTVTDYLGCSLVSPSYTVTQLAPPLTLLDTTILDVPCRGDSSGAIVPQIGGGTPAYQYAWSNGALTPSLVNIPAGNYMLTLSDAAGCYEFWTFNIVQPATAPGATWTTDSTAAGWRITLNPAGGAPPYDMRWDAATGNQTGPVASGLTAGLYRVTVTDDNGCSAVLSIPVGTFTSLLPLAFDWAAQLTPNPAPAAGWLKVRLPESQPLEVQVFNVIGQPVWMASSGKTDQHNVYLDLGQVPPGWYWVVLRLGNGARRTLGWVVGAPG